MLCEIVQCKGSPGMLHVALSRVNTIGTFSPDESHPTDSAIYWKGCGTCTTRITEGTLRRGKRKKDLKRDYKKIEDH